MDLDTGEVVCARCGAVILERVEAEDGGERRWRGDLERGEHVGPPQSALHPIGRETVVGPGGGWEFSRLRAMDARGTRGDGERADAASAISAISGALSLPAPVQEEAMRIFLRVHGAGATRGRTTHGMAAAAVLAALRWMGIPRRIADVAEAAGMDRRVLWAHYRALVEALGDGRGSRSPRPEDFVARVASAVAPGRDAGRIARRALELLGALRDLDGESMEGKDPMGLAAGAVYLAAGAEGIRATQCGIAQAVGVTEVTVRHGASVIRAALTADARAELPQR
ncbi:Transcription initiation factor B [Conexivisphaera calida]|uniref:Transcription initiation factor IIB n=1 Tax=Conexivisphaera calida TaxID=1874277 RepID=A0A4P2VD29_9ARCH|nr:Transcription initiation factor B [Conexivisphaera calida]